MLPRDRNKVLTALAGTEPIVGAQGAPAQKLQFFLSESAWNVGETTARRLEMLHENPVTRPHEDGVLVIDETGDRKDGTKTDHVAHQYLGSIGRIANGIVSVSSIWADEEVYHPLHVEPYTPAKRLSKGNNDPAFRTKPEIAAELVERTREASIPFRAVVADCLYGENPAFQSALWKTSVPYVLSLRPHKGRWAEAEAAHTPVEAAQDMGWRSAQEPGAWQRIMRTFKDGHTEQWWAVEVTTLIHHGPEKYLRLVAVTTDPATLPTNSSWYLMTNIPAPGYRRTRESSFEAADLAEVVRIYGLRQWVEQSYRQLKGELGFADFEVRSDRAIRRHWELVFCAFCFCWWAHFGSSRRHSWIWYQTPYLHQRYNRNHRRRAKRRSPTTDFFSVMAGGSAAGAELAGPLGNAVALVEGVVERAPATTVESTA